MGVEGDNNLMALQCWLKTRSHLPQNIEPLLMRRYIQSCRNDVEKAKKLLEYSFTLRNNNPHIFLQRDPCDKATQKVHEAVDMLPLPNTTKENYKVLFYRLVEYGTENYNFTEIIKVFFMVADVRLITPDQNGLTDGEIPVFDMAGFTLRHLTKVVLSSLRCYMKYTQIPIGCLQIACVILQKELKAWFAELNVDMDKIQEIARAIMNLYELWKGYDEKKEIQELLVKMPKPKPAPQR